MYRLVKEGNQHFIETFYLHHAEPKRCFIRWKVLETNGYIPETMPEFEARHVATEGELSSWSLYCGNGRYLTLVTPRHGQNHEEPVAPPRVKATTETRWTDRGWQKYDRRKGWVHA